jgi:hypothetical protein
MARSPLEQAVVIAGDPVLAGILLGAGGDADGPRAAAVIAPPHPLYGGSMDSPVVNELNFALHGCGIAALRFNWRGVGASGGDITGDVSAATADYEAASLHMEETVAGPLVAAGYSFGAVAAALVAATRARLQRLLLVSPPVRLLDTALLSGAVRDTLVITGEHDEYAPPAALERACHEARGVTLRVIPGADHFFARGLADIAREAQAWL